RGPDPRRDPLRRRALLQRLGEHPASHLPDAGPRRGALPHRCAARPRLVRLQPAQGRALRHARHRRLLRLERRPRVCPWLGAARCIAKGLRQAVRRVFPKAALVLAALLFLNVAQAQTITVFAAASLKNALDEAAALFERESGSRVRLSYAASSALAR